ncbi:MAG: superoxide dismutase [Candidatus Omnitrophica bacterium]|nr:superoxide dismutase [Candidatus Omnitrophota bacterium]MCM8770844.1 superoxide dismutase [Candidatus Omnitrophota bacterium]
MAVIFSYSVKEYAHLLGMPGFSDVLLNNHFKLYQGYVKNTNLLIEKINTLSSEAKDKTPEYAELKRRFGWEFNGMRLHEYYFENLGGKSQLDPKGPLYKKIIEDFDSFELWKQDFVSTGIMRGIGWVILYQEPQSKRLLNVWINEHDVGHLSGAYPLLVMDVFEHAYFIDYQLERAKYIDNFFANINWQEVEKRFK